MLLFVGEQRSPTAQARHWTWADGHLAARTLAEALAPLDLHFGRHYACLNLWSDAGELDEGQLTRIRLCQAWGWQVIGLGRLVQRRLRQAGIPHTPMIHPAARGKIRARAHYHAHVRATLVPVLTRRMYDTPLSLSQYQVPHGRC